MIGLAPPGQPRPWQLNAAVTTLRATFPGAKVHIHHYDRRAAFTEFVVQEVITITAVRELFTTTSWASRRLRVGAEILAACQNERDVARLIEGVVPGMDRGVVVEVGEIRQAEAETKREAEVRSDDDRKSRGRPKEPVIAEQAPIRRGPRLGRRVPAEELRPLLRGVVIR